MKSKFRNILLIIIGVLAVAGVSLYLARDKIFYREDRPAGDSPIVGITPQTQYLAADDEVYDVATYVNNLPSNIPLTYTWSGCASSNGGRATPKLPTTGSECNAYSTTCSVSVQ